MKAFRSLVSGEDAELKSAYERFHKMVEREQGIVRNAILAGVEQLKLDSSSIHTDVKGAVVGVEELKLEVSETHKDVAESLAVAGQMDKSLSAVAAGTGRIQNYIQSKRPCFS